MLERRHLQQRQATETGSKAVPGRAAPWEGQGLAPDTGSPPPPTRKQRPEGRLARRTHEELEASQIQTSGVALFKDMPAACAAVAPACVSFSACSCLLFPRAEASSGVATRPRYADNRPPRVSHRHAGRCQELSCALNIRHTCLQRPAPTAGPKDSKYHPCG